MVLGSCVAANMASDLFGVVVGALWCRPHPERMRLVTAVSAAGDPDMYDGQMVRALVVPRPPQRHT